MNEYVILPGCSNEDPNTVIIIGNHFDEKQAIDILIRKKEISESDNLEVSELRNGWAKFIKKDLGDYIDCAETDKGYLFEWGAEQPRGYNRKATMVELIEVDAPDKYRKSLAHL